VPDADPATAVADAINKAGGDCVHRPTLLATEDATAAAAGRCPFLRVLGGVAAAPAYVGDCVAMNAALCGAKESSSVSSGPAGPFPRDASVTAAALAVARVSVGDFSTPSTLSALSWLRAARAARRSSIF